MEILSEIPDDNKPIPDVKAPIKTLDDFLIAKSEPNEDTLKKEETEIEGMMETPRNITLKEVVGPKISNNPEDKNILNIRNKHIQTAQNSTYFYKDGIEARIVTDTDTVKWNKTIDNDKKRKMFSDSDNDDQTKSIKIKFSDDIDEPIVLQKDQYIYGTELNREITSTTTY